MPCQNIHLTANPKCFLQLTIPQPITHFAFGVLAEGEMRKLLMVSIMLKTLLGEEPGGGIGAGRLADEISFVGIVVGSLDQPGCKSASSQRFRDKGVFYDKCVAT